MSKFSISFLTEDDAFADGNFPRETARILREIADRVLRGEQSGKVRDVNGNTIGSFEYGPQ